MLVAVCAFVGKPLRKLWRPRWVLAWLRVKCTVSTFTLSTWNSLGRSQLGEDDMIVSFYLGVRRQEGDPHGTGTCRL